MTSRTHDGRAFRMLNILDEYTRECLDISVERKITSHRVIERLAHLFITNGHRSTYALITGLSSPQRRYTNGWQTSG